MLSGLDLCPSWLIEVDGEETQAPLVDIFNLFFESGDFLEGLKEVVVVPLLKKPPLDPTDPANYHLILNLLFLGKVVDKATAEQIQGFLDNILAPDPF